MPINIREQIANDHLLALRMARHECVDAGLSEHSPLTEEVVVRSQGDRLQKLQSVAANHKAALQVARHECVDAGLSEHAVLTDAFVQKIQRIAAPAAQAPRPAPPPPAQSAAPQPAQARQSAPVVLALPPSVQQEASSAAPRAGAAPASGGAPHADAAPHGASPRGASAPAPLALADPSPRPQQAPRPAPAQHPAAAAPAGMEVPDLPPRSSGFIRHAAIGGASAEALRARMHELGAPDMLHAAGPRARLVAVHRDGNCGFYSLLAGLLRQGMRRPAVAAGIRNLPIAAEEQGPEAARGRQVLARWSTMVERGQGAAALAEAQDPDNLQYAVDAQMALRSSSAALLGKRVPKPNTEWADSDDLGAVAGHLDVQLVEHSSDNTYVRGAAAGLLARARNAPDTIHLLHGSGHYDLFLPRG